MIPRLLHQFWDTGKPPVSVSALTATWSEMNPDWRYRLWCDADILQLLENDLRVRNAFMASAMPAMRADLARYIILYRFGGVYADADLTCLKPMDEVLAPEADLVVFRGWNMAWRNDFMAAAPGNALMGQFIDCAVSNIEKRISNNVWLVTGPGMTTPILEAARSAAGKSIQTFDFNEIKGKVLTFNHDLDYRSNGQHWAEAQKSQSIFRELAENP